MATTTDDAASEGTTTDGRQDLREAVAPDPTLASLVAVANNTGIGTSVTLTVAGTVVTGQIIPGRKYFDQCADRVRHANVTGLGATPEAQTTVVAALADAYEAMRDKLYPEDRPDDEDQLFAFIHLEQASIWSGAWIELGAWRGRLSEVSGWSLAGLVHG